jgi:hypothetical protein
MSTDPMQPDIGFYFDAMSTPLDTVSMQYRADGRFETIATLVETISEEWQRNNEQAAIDLDTLGPMLAEVQSTHPTDSNVDSLVLFYLALQDVRKGPWYTPSKVPPTRKAVPPTAKLTVFDVAGTAALSVLTAGRAGSPTTSTAPGWGLAQLTNSSLVAIKEVPYPACVPFNASYRAGAATLVNMINQTPGKFAMVGTSQGAMVITSVYDEIYSGKLSSRNGDFLQGITYGNPCRKAKSIAPGCVDPGGHGINVNSWLQSSVDSRWWDFVNPGDPAACNGAGPWNVGGITYDYSGSNGTWTASLFAKMCKNFNGNLAALIGQLQNPPQNIAALAISLFEVLTGVTVGPHTTYGQTTPIAGNPLTCAKLAAQQLMAIAASLP